MLQEVRMLQEVWILRAVRAELRSHAAGAA
jgi:hypothetical protein